jgi:hypothetical protein
MLSVAEPKHLYRIPNPGVRNYYAKEMLRLRYAALSMTGVSVLPLALV